MPAPINLLRPSLPFAFGKFAHHSTHGKPHSSMPLDAAFRNKVSRAYGKGAGLHPHFAIACLGSLKMMVIINTLAVPQQKSLHFGSDAFLASVWPTLPNLWLAPDALVSVLMMSNSSRVDI